MPFYRRRRSTAPAFLVRPIVLTLVVTMIAFMTDLLPTRGTATLAAPAAAVQGPVA